MFHTDISIMIHIDISVSGRKLSPKLIIHLRIANVQAILHLHISRGFNLSI
jgi:hypothetical protein